MASATVAACALLVASAILTPVNLRSCASPQETKLTDTRTLQDHILGGWISRYCVRLATIPNMLMSVLALSVASLLLQSDTHPQPVPFKGSDTAPLCLL